MTTKPRIPEEYISYDYGFSGVDSPEAQPEIKPVVSPEIETKIDDLHNKLDAALSKMANPSASEEADQMVTKLRSDIHTLETIIVPLLNNLLKTSNKDYIYWPNRATIIETQLNKVLSITRG